MRTTAIGHSVRTFGDLRACGRGVSFGAVDAGNGPEAGFFAVDETAVVVVVVAGAAGVCGWLCGCIGAADSTPCMVSTCKNWSAFVASSGGLYTHITGARLAKFVLHNFLDVRVHLFDQIQEGLHMLLGLLL